MMIQKRIGEGAFESFGRARDQLRKEIVSFQKADAKELAEKMYCESSSFLERMHHLGDKIMEGSRLWSSSCVFVATFIFPNCLS